MDSGVYVLRQNIGRTDGYAEYSGAVTRVSSAFVYCIAACIKAAARAASCCAIRAAASIAKQATTVGYSLIVNVLIQVT